MSGSNANKETTSTDAVLNAYYKALDRRVFTNSPQFKADSAFECGGRVGCPSGIVVNGPWGNANITWLWGSCGSALLHGVNVDCAGSPTKEMIYKQLIEMLDIACKNLSVCKILFTDIVRNPDYSTLYGFGMDNPKHVIAGRAVQNPNTHNKIVAFEYTPTYLLPPDDLAELTDELVTIMVPRT